jgi:hypothetical protein
MGVGEPVIYYTDPVSFHPRRDHDTGLTTAPWLLRLFNRLPVLRRIPARLIGMGFRPEHVRSPRAQS